MKTTERLQPAIYPIRPGSIAPVRKANLDNMITVFLIEAGTEDIMRAEFVFRAGQIKENIQLLASSTNMMLTEGSEKYSPEEINRLLDYYGVFYHLFSEKDTAGLVVYFLSRYIEKVLDLVQQVLFKPLFLEKELSLLMKKRLRWYLISHEKTQNIASDKFFESIFGSSHPYGKQPGEKDFLSLNPDHLREFHQKYYIPADLTVIISGKLHVNTLEILNKYLGGIETERKAVKESATTISGETDKKILIKKEGTFQSSLRIGSLTVNKRHPDYPGIKFLNTVLGGYFGSRLMKNLREEKGYTYGIHSVVTSLDISGYKVITAEVSNKSTQNAIAEIYKEIRKLRIEPVGNDELQVVRNYMLGEMVRMFDGPFAMAESFRGVWEFGLDAGYYQRMEDKIKTITAEEIMQLANTYFDQDELYEIVAG